MRFFLRKLDHFRPVFLKTCPIVIFALATPSVFTFGAS
ncbi:Uncharacterised protein [Vibrio cholerae]|nr:Uncharacterised protein [Vibrio cholerae]CSI60152.1 Uncharacterised protein [Vibrio cholerae]